jgi:DNA invertase Pin-like site-specific DNA recombinase
MLKDAGRRKFDILVAWAVVRLGRSLIDLLRTIQDLEAVGVICILISSTLTPQHPLASCSST